MATTATAAPGKTSFVKQFLNDHPDGTTKTVNEAWQAAGFDGTISHPIISQVRKKLGLTGNLPGKTRKSAKEKSAPRHAQNSNQGPGQDKIREGFPRRPSTGQRQSRERGVGGCREGWDNRLHPRPQDESRRWD